MEHKITMRKKSPLKAIKEKCKEDCCAGDRKSWVDCTITTCPLWNYRFGTREIPQKYNKKNKQAV